MTQAFSITALIGVLLCQPAMAQETSAADMRQGPVVVELFTSQGCAACPPADAMIAELADREDVIALSLHVDYWNYLGWEDTFSDAAFTQRQYGYSHAHHSTVVYTPFLIIGGSHPVMPDRAMQVADHIAAHRTAPDPVHLSVAPSGAGYAVEAQWADPAPAPEMVVQLVAYSPRETVEITPRADLSHAVIVQTAGHGAILGAIRLD